MKNSTLRFVNLDINNGVALPYIRLGINAGFPSPAADFTQTDINIFKEIVKHPDATFYAEAIGNSMKDVGINNGDIMVIDRSLEPKTNDIAVCFTDGGFTVKTIKIEKDGIWLIPANDEFKPRKIVDEEDFKIWGIVTFVIKKTKRV